MVSRRSKSIPSPISCASATNELRRLEQCMIAIRDAVGPEIEIAVDGHWRFLAPAAVQIAKTLEPFNPMFLEEPTTSDN